MVLLSAQSYSMNVCLPLCHQPFWIGKEVDDSLSNRLRTSKPMLIVITTFLAYSLIIFIYWDAISSSYYLFVHRLTISQKIWLTPPIC
jgi:hypothetical protein